MRVIKFRAWEKNLREIIPVHNIDFEKRMINTDSAWRTFDEIKLMQYTGLIDKNGVEIYEGDIVKLIKPDSHYVIKGDGFEDVGNDVGFEVTGEVKFLYSMWFVEESDERGIPLDFDEKQVLEIIGNVYKHPEFLERSV